MRLVELFQKYYTYSRLDDKHYMFDTDQKLRYLVHFEQVSIPVGWQLQKMPVIGFAIVDAEGEVSDVVQHTGDAFNVFGTVGKIIQDHLHKFPTDYLAIGAKLNEPSRVKLYQTFIKYLPKFLPNWTLEFTSDTIDPSLRVWVLKNNS